MEWSFNSRTRVGATPRNPSNNSNHIVSIHAPVWVRQELRGSFERIDPFQFTHPCGCDGMGWDKFMRFASFNSRTRVGATRQNRLWRDVYSGFNSRTRVGATRAEIESAIMWCVSIHAPVWVRQSRIWRQDGQEWFQFTHPCGCDVLRRLHGRRKRGFNSRTRVGATRYGSP